MAQWQQEGEGEVEVGPARDEWMDGIPEMAGTRVGSMVEVREVASPSPDACAGCTDRVKCRPLIGHHLRPANGTPYRLTHTFHFLLLFISTPAASCFSVTSSLDTYTMDSSGQPLIAGLGVQWRPHIYCHNQPDLLAPRPLQPTRQTMRELKTNRIYS
jgi:hypothetical protein